jgi:uncharacterized protein with gpF-like domain
MAFQARKTRQQRAPEPVGRGTPINPSAAIRRWYESQMAVITRTMIEEYRSEIKKALEAPSVEKLFATDAAATNALTGAMTKLGLRWKKIFSAFAERTSADFMRRVEEGATKQTLMSLSTAGIDQPRAAYSSNVANTLQAGQLFNDTLIKGIQADVHEKVHNAVMLSLTSPNPEEQGQPGIEKALKDIGGFSKERIRLISEDQTSKMYASLSDENGIEEFEWAHSSAGKHPRESHKKMDGKIFKLDDPRLWQVGGEFDLKKGDLGPPGWAIRCRCRKIPII